MRSADLHIDQNGDIEVIPLQPFKPLLGEDFWKEFCELEHRLYATMGLPIEFVLSGDTLALYRWLQTRHLFQPSRTF